MTNELKNKEISIGWDVGGWSGKNHGVCVLLSDNGKIDLLKAVKLNVFEVKENIETILKDYLSTHKITIGIDAPLQFPALFKEILNNNPINIFEQIQNQPKQNRISWRTTDLFIKEQFGKTPLSPSFSFLTSNATVAISLLGEMKAKFKDISILPFDEKSQINVLEVYPGLLKSPKMKDSGLLKHYHKMIEQLGLMDMQGFEYYFGEAKDKSDVADAIICAFYGLGFNHNIQKIPALENVIPESMAISAQTEGWIYYPKME